jgi:hypothetical protein
LNFSQNASATLEVGWRHGRAERYMCATLVLIASKDERTNSLASPRNLVKYSGAHAKHFEVNAVMMRFDVSLALFIALSTSTQNRNLSKKTSLRESRWDDVIEASSAAEAAAM